MTDDETDDVTEDMAAMTRKLAREDDPDDLEKTGSHDFGDAPASEMARQKSQADDGDDDDGDDKSVAD